MRQDSNGYRWLTAGLLLCTAPIWAAAADDASGATESPPAITGIVKDPAGTPLPGATVWVRVKDHLPGNRHQKPDEWLDPVSVITDEKGRFAAAMDSDGPFSVFFVHPAQASAGYGPPVESGATIEFTFPEPHSFAGHVRNRSGEPVANADVTACSGDAPTFGVETCLRTRSDNEGVYRFDRLAKGRLTLQAWAPGHTLSHASAFGLPVETDDPLPEGLVLGPGAEVSGSVTDDGGTPLAGVQVYYMTDRVRLGTARGVQDTRPLVAIFTDDEGGFAFRGVPAGEPLKMVAAATDRRVAQSDGLTLEAGSVISGVTIVQDRTASVIVHLVDRDEQPIRALEVLWLPTKEKAPERNTGFRMAGFAGRTKVESRGKGRFRVTEIKPGRYQLTLLPEGHREIEIQDLVIPPGGEVDLGTRVGNPGTVLSGRVIDDRGHPVEDAKVEANYLRDNVAMARSTKSGADGTFVLGGLVEGPLLWLRGDADGHAGIQQQGVDADQTGYEVVLQRAGSVRGQVTLHSGEKPSHVEAKLEDASSGMTAFRRGDGGSGKGDRDGHFTIEEAAPGNYTLRLSARGARPTSVRDVLVEPGVDTDVGTHRLEQGKRLRGNVVDGRDGSPVARATVRVDRPGNMTRSRDSMGTAVTDSDGEFEVDGLEPGRLIVRVEHVEFAPGKEEANVPEDEPAEDLTVRLGRGGTLRGTVREASGSPAPERALGVIEGGGFVPSDGVIRTNDAGEYSVERMRPGTYSVMLYPDAMGGPMNIQRKTATIREGEETVVDFDNEDRIVFEGRLLRGGRPVGEVNVVLMPTEAGGMMQMRSASVDVSGRFEVNLERPGQYNVIVQDMKKGIGGLVGQARIVVPDEPTVSLDIVLQSGTISGTVLDADGNPIEGAAVSAELEGARPDDYAANTGALVSADGSFRIEGAQEGNYTLSAIADGYQIATRSVTVGGSSAIEGVEFRLEVAGALRGRVVDEFGNGIAGAYVFASPAGSANLNSAIPTETDGEGYFRVSAPSDGPCDIEASATGLAPGRALGVPPLQGPDDPGPVITLTRGGTIVVRVVNAAGEPVAGEQPAVQPDQPTRALTLSLMFSPAPPTDDRGASRIAALAPGGYRVSLAGKPAVPSRPVTVSEGQESVVTLQLP